MQDCYAGDIGDFGKFALLREMARVGFHLGINWYKADMEISKNQEDGKYRILIKYFCCDEKLASTLYRISVSDGLPRSIQSLEQSALIDNAVYFSEPVPLKAERKAWHESAMLALSGCNLVFLIPIMDF